MLIRTNPPGALVHVDNQEVGTTPCAVDFTYYGTREIRLVKDGYETLTVNQPFPTPWYEIPPLDLVSETLIPYTVHDNRQVAYNLEPQMVVPGEQLLARAESLRQSTHGGRSIPSTASDPAALGQPDAATFPPGGESLPAPAPVPFPPPRPHAQTLPPGGMEFPSDGNEHSLDRSSSLDGSSNSEPAWLPGNFRTE